MHYTPEYKTYTEYFEARELAKKVELERLENMLRLITYNNKRIARGLRPLEHPPALLGIGSNALPERRSLVGMIAIDPRQISLKLH